MNNVFSAPDFSLVTNVFEGWTANYLVKTTPEQVWALVEAWMKDYIPTGYRVAEAQPCQRLRWALPFAYCRMVRYPVNRFGWCGEAMMYVRTGGNDLQPGQAEIMYFQIVPPGTLVIRATWRCASQTPRRSTSSECAAH